MEKYQKMYAILCGGISEALDVLPYSAQTFHARLLLEKALREAEEIYIREDHSADFSKMELS